MGTVLLILKIIGIILLVLLGIILILALLVVFYPVSYKLSASYEDTAVARLKVHWLFHLISVTLNYEREKKKCILRILGIPIMDFLNPKPRKEKKKKEKASKKKASKKKKQKSAEPVYEEETDRTVKTEKSCGINTSSTEYDGQALREETATDGGEEAAGTESRLKALWSKITGFFQKIKKVIESILQKLKDIYTKGVNLKEKINSWIEVLERERTRQALDKAKYHIVDIIRHILPRKWKAVVILGFDDPALTGKIMGYYWMFIGLWGEHLICTPDFENKVFKGTIEAKGYIQVFKFIYAAYKFMFDKDLVYLRKINEEVNS